MRRKIFCFMFVVALVLVGVMPAMAEGEGKPDLQFRVLPKLGYNPIDEWRLGAQVKLDYIFGYDTLDVYGEYGFHSKEPHSGLQYLYRYDTYQFYTKLAYDIKAGGVYNGEALWQDTRSIAVGALKAEFPFGEGYYYVGDLMVQYKDLTPANTPGDMVFSTGQNITIEPSIIGFYKGILGSLDLAYGFPTQVSDYHYFKADAFLKKVFKITESDRLVLSTELGVIRGTYPVQENFFLGSSVNNTSPDSKQKSLNNLGAEKPIYQLPVVALDGYRDNAFYGNNLFAGKVEFQKVFDGVDWPYAVYPVAKVYTVFGNAWDGGLTTGFARTNAAVGMGLHLESHMFDRLGTDNWYFGINVARGFGEQAATTIGFEAGTDLTLLNF